MPLFPIFACLVLLTPAAVFGATPTSPLKPPPEEILEEARMLVKQMKNNERGPYRRIRWFCNDGSIHPPHAYACKDLGGGRQHAEYSEERNRLAQLGWHVGTVIAALSWDELWSPPRHTRLRELPLERHMIDHHNGWVLSKALDYRGRVQLEDEETAGRKLLLRLLQQPDWLSQNYLLALQLIQTIPHHGAEGRSYQIRQLAQNIAEKDSAFNRLRIEIHSRPSPTSANRVRMWALERDDLPPDVLADTTLLANGLDDLYGESARQTRLLKAEQFLAQTVPDVASLLAAGRQQQGIERVARLTKAMATLRDNTPADKPSASLYRLNLVLALASEVRAAASELLVHNSLSRRELILLATHLLQGAWASGLLSEGEQQALAKPMLKLLQEDSAAGSLYSHAARRLSLAAAWSTMTVRYTFAEALSQYSALDHSAERFVDETLRGSVLLPLGEVAQRLALDGAAVAGLSHHFFGTRSSGLLGINPGVARAKLRVISSEELALGIQPAADEIVVLPETVAELTPVAGILTLGEGNPLSHVQMLARNLGIPNLVVAPTLLPRLQQESGQTVLLAVSADGRVYLEREVNLPAFVRAKTPAAESIATSLVTVPPPNLEQLSLLPLAELHAGLSGKLVGPKAANVGELARRFPGRIAPAVAIPFGIFAEYTESQRVQVDAAYGRFRLGELDQEGLNAVLDQMRNEVSSTLLREDLVEQLRTAMTQEFGAPNSYGLFVRSDTNVEDLPQFTGAGLNETIPNVVGLEAQLKAIPRVWGSVYSRRAMAWRGRILQHPDQVFASILLMKSIAAEKSGVLVTKDLHSGQAGLTVSAAWGVGGAVDNESAATLVLREDGSSLLLAEAKAPYRRELNPNGGVQWVPAESGPVLNTTEQHELQKLAAEVIANYPPVRDDQDETLPWDIEFAFADGKLWLLQIRPLVQRGHIEANQLINRLLPTPQPKESIQLDELALSAGG